MQTCVISPGVVHAVPRTVAMARYLDDVHFIDMTGTADRATLERAGVHYHLPAEGGTSRLPSLDLQRLLARLAPDVLVCHYGSGDHFFNAIAYGRCPVAVIAMGNDVLYDDGDSRVSPLRGLLTRLGLRRAAFISAKSKFIAEATRRLGYRGRMEVNYWGADLQRFQPGAAAEARRALGLPAAGALVLSPRAIEPLYNIQLIVEALAEVAKRRPDVQLLILGRANPAYSAEVEKTVERLGLQPQVRIVGDVPYADLPAWYRASDAVVSVARVEGFPNTVLEVMGCGVPVLVGDIPQVRELLTDGGNARLCAVEVPAIARGLLSLLDDPAAAAAMALRGRQTALDAGDIDANGRRFAQALRELVGSPSGGALALLPFRLLLLACLLLKRAFAGIY